MQTPSLNSIYQSKPKPLYILSSDARSFVKKRGGVKNISLTLDGRQC